jgi:hypothetical protein
VSGSRRALETASRCRAQLSWRLPPRSSQWRSVRPEDAGIGADPAVRASFGVGREALDAGDFADQLGGGQHAAAALGQQPRRELGDQRRELALERVDRARQLADAAQLVARDLHPGCLLSAPQPASDALLPAAADQRAFGDLELGPEVVQGPAQVVDQRGALCDEPLAMIDQQADVELGAGQLRGR